jgi:Lrp/AsnC family transcriptional regulator for asnA, asnC and gidA
MDGRYKNTQLAVELNISEAAVRSRIKHLQEIGAVQIVALCNPLIMGHRGVRLLLDVEAGSHVAVLAATKSISQLNQLSVLNEGEMVYLDVTCRDLEQLVDILDILRNIENVLRIRPLVLTHLYKDYSWNGLVGSKGQSRNPN